MRDIRSNGWDAIHGRFRNLAMGLHPAVPMIQSSDDLRRARATGNIGGMITAGVDSVVTTAGAGAAMAGTGARPRTGVGSPVPSHAQPIAPVPSERLVALDAMSFRQLNTVRTSGLLNPNDALMVAPNVVAELGRAGIAVSDIRAAGVRVATQSPVGASVAATRIADNLRAFGGRGAASAGPDALNLAEAAGLDASVFVTVNGQALRAFPGVTVLPGTGGSHPERCRIRERFEMMVTKRGDAQLSDGLVRLRTDYQPSDHGPGRLELEFEHLVSRESATTSTRLDPWFGEGYKLFEFSDADCVVLCGAQACVVVRTTDGVLCSMLGFEYEECESMDEPWHEAVPTRGAFLMATDRRIWCLDSDGSIKWVWSYSVEVPNAFLIGCPIVDERRVRLLLQTQVRTHEIWLSLDDGLPI